MAMYNQKWVIIFCELCQEPTPPLCGMMTDELGFVCDDCLNIELEGLNYANTSATSRHETS